MVTDSEARLRWLEITLGTLLQRLQRDEAQIGQALQGVQQVRTLSGGGGAGNQAYIIEVPSGGMSWATVSGGSPVLGSAASCSTWLVSGSSVTASATQTVYNPFTMPTGGASTVPAGLYGPAVPMSDGSLLLLNLSCP